MKTITVCVGSSCYIKGAHIVARTLEERGSKTIMANWTAHPVLFCAPVFAAYF